MLAHLLGGYFVVRVTSLSTPYLHTVQVTTPWLGMSPVDRVTTRGLVILR